MSAAPHTRYLIRLSASGGDVGDAGDSGDAAQAGARAAGGAGGFAALVSAAGGALVELSLFHSAAAARAAAPGCVELGADGPPPLAEVRRQLAQYLAGERRDFDLPLAPAGTEFERRVWQALVAIPYGATRSYGEIARTVGRPEAYRAVGRANGSNPIAVVIPCHRVIGSDGSLTGYGGGLPLKRFLLDLESGKGGGDGGGTAAAQRELPLVP